MNLNVTAAAWLVGLSGIAAVVLATQMTGWTIGVRNGHWVAALVLAGAVALLLVVGDPDREPGRIDGQGLVVGVVVAVLLPVTVIGYNAIPVCSWWHARYEAGIHDPHNRDHLWDLCADPRKAGGR